MKFGIVGLGSMGGGLALQALERGHEVVGSSRTEKPGLAETGVPIVGSLAELKEALPPPRVVFLSLPAGEVTEKVARELGGILDAGDVIVDGANSHWEDYKRLHAELKEGGIRFLDCGVSGGVEGARQGACFMVGGEREAFEIAEPIFRDLSVKGGYLHAGPPGAGHFVKLIHNMIEFGMVQAIGEGVELLMRSEYELDLPALFRNWNHGSVIRGWLVELMERGFREHGDLSSLEPHIQDTGEQVWGVEYAMEREVPIPLLSQAVWGFYESRDPDRGRRRWPSCATSTADTRSRKSEANHGVLRRAPGHDCPRPAALQRRASPEAAPAEPHNFRRALLRSQPRQRPGRGPSPPPPHGLQDGEETPELSLDAMEDTQDLAPQGRDGGPVHRASARPLDPPHVLRAIRRCLGSPERARRCQAFSSAPGTSPRASSTRIATSRPLSAAAARSAGMRSSSWKAHVPQRSTSKKSGRALAWGC